MLFRIVCLLLFATLFKVGTAQTEIICEPLPNIERCAYETSIVYQSIYRRIVTCITDCDRTTKTCIFNQMCPLCTYYDVNSNNDVISNFTFMRCGEFTQCENTSMKCVDFLSQFTDPPPSESSPPQTPPTQAPSTQTTLSWSTGSTILLSIMLVVDLLLVIVYVARMGRRK